MLLFDTERVSTPMPVLEFFTEGRFDVSDDLEATGIGFGYTGHEADGRVYALKPADGKPNGGGANGELYFVRFDGSPKRELTPTRHAFVTTARQLSSYDNDKPYPQTDDLDYVQDVAPLRPAVIKALTTAVTKNNGRGRFPEVIPV